MVQLRFRAVDRDLFDHVRAGRKRYELRANTDRFQDVQAGDSITVVCDGETAAMRAKQVRRFADLRKVFDAIPVAELLPDVTDSSVAIERIERFPRYAEKIRSHGVVVMELEHQA